ncbi:uncharacterized protein N7483_012488 [Penicillium malachiteum]|uniref:uncharacterized protein n=1 Tax=Penicillium malachiteum TaxID=1324776 RepID=UPI0025477AAE|nr:uncharacterized protein N7483_012488 [Penicillium malachiteum]KAJ5715307.1 hypothetical protein N7483_012488 [Penicillium malachiteum]
MTQYDIFLEAPRNHNERVDYKRDALGLIVSVGTGPSPFLILSIATSEEFSSDYHHGTPNIMVESVDATPETEQSVIFDSSTQPGELTPPTPIRMGKLASRQEEPSEEIPVLDEINFLKMRIEELAAGVQVAAEQTPLPMGGSDSNVDPPPPGSSEWAKYQKSINAIYQRRKEWENTEGPGWWDMYRSRNRFVRRQREDGPWDWAYRISASNDYSRRFPPEVYNGIADIPSGGAPPDDYDCLIDYGNRRERLRKNFEWEMDRLYLVEEIEIRRREREEEQKNEKERIELLSKVRKEEESKRAEENKGGDETCAQVEESCEPVEKEEIKEVLPEPDLRRLDWYAFSRTAVGVLECCNIHVLIGDPVVQDDMLPAYGAWYGYPGRPVRKPKKTQESAPILVTAPEEAQLPERIRIQSAILMKVLTKILGNDADPLSSYDTSGVVFLRPFKALIYSERAIRDWCAALDKKFSMPLPITAEEAVNPSTEALPAGSTPEEAAATSPLASPDNQEELEVEVEDGKEEEQNDDADDVTKSPEALKHLQCLVKFMDTTTSPRRAHLENPQSRKIFFSDLWLLFRPGMEVIGSDGKQAYRVVHVTSARHAVLPTWKRYRSSGDKRQKAAFSITCVYIDFDGKSFGPISRVFEFKRFDGQRDIAALEVYPLRFHPLRRTDFSESEWTKVESLSLTNRTARYREQLISRGRKFLSVAGVRHMYYAGPTVGVRDEVESQVVVDFETAFSVEDAEQQEWKPKLELLIGNPTNQSDGDDDERCEAICCQGDYVHYDGYVDTKQRTEYVNGLLPKTDTGDEQPSIAIISRSLKDLRAGAGNTLAVSEDELVIMSYRVFGFVLRTRKWAKLDLSYLTEIPPPKVTPGELGFGSGHQWADTKVKPSTTFGRLVLDQKHKHMIISLIAQHFRDKKTTTDHREQRDIVRGKGKGLILLLHGAPGVGKTSTAEGVAELFQKPLFQITCGDLGTTASEVEKALETTFALANRWDCILLLDEADVFLAQRTKEDFQRNGLVAVFLRVMEYYAGILFLTTNRVGDFDEAFTSRIHVSLYYKELSSEQTVEIFKLNMSMIEERFSTKGRRIEIDQMRIGSFAEKHYAQHENARWNGRQIRNACQTALALAEFEAQGNSHQAILRPDAVVTLSMSHFETVRDAYLEFTEYINSLWGANASQRAQEDKVRAIWLDENDNIVGTQGLDKKALFLHAMRKQGGAGHSPPVAPPSVGVKWPVASEQYYDYPHGHTNTAGSGQLDLNLTGRQSQWNNAPGQMGRGRAGTGAGPELPHHPQPQRPMGNAGAHPARTGQQHIYSEYYGDYADPGPNEEGPQGSGMPRTHTPGPRGDYGPAPGPY